MAISDSVCGARPVIVKLGVRVYGGAKEGNRQEVEGQSMRSLEFS